MQETKQNQLEQVLLREEIKQIQEEIVQVRRHFHQYPETAYEEVQTAKFIVNKLKELGNIEIIENVGVTGVVGILRGKFEGPCILLRADMDALDLTENSGEEFQSKNVGKHHACGHDGHCSMLLAAAKVVSKWTDKMHGIIKFCFQPAEERGAGAKAMVEDKKYPLLQNPKVDVAYGAHLYNTLYYPDICTKAGPMNANSDRVTITIKGKGSSAYLPQFSTDSIYIGSQLVNQLYSITARNIDPMNPATISVGQINGGTAPNIISETCQITVSVRSNVNEDRELMKNRIFEICKGMEISYNCKIDVDYIYGYNCIQNSELQVENVMKSAKKISPKVFTKQFGLAGEDFCFIASEVNSAFFLIGSAPEGSITDNGRNVTIPHHSPLFTIDERCLHLGASVWVQLIEDQLIKQ